MTDLTFAYKRRPFMLFMMILFGAAGAFGMAYAALYDMDLEISFLGLYATGWEAKALAWFSAICMAGLGMIGLWGLARSGRAPKAVTLGAEAISAPKAPLSSKIVTVRFEDITKVRTEDMMGQVMLHVTHPDGKMTITKSWLADKDAFDTIKVELRSRWDRATGVNVS